MVVFVGGVLSTTSVVRDTQWVEHTHRVIEALDDVMESLLEAGAARQAYALSDSPEHQARFASSSRDLTAAQQRVRNLVGDNAGQLSRMDVMDGLVAARLASLGAAMTYRATHGFDLQREASETDTGSIQNAELRTFILDTEAEERRLLAEREQRMAQGLRRAGSLEAIGAAASITLIVTVIARLRREIRRRTHSERALRESELTLKMLNEQLDAHVTARTTQLEVANRELESFTYTVVHNLRSPLRGMGGFAEVLLIEHGETLGAEARDSLQEIRQNARQMAVLIDGLASMSQIVRRDLQCRSVDLTGLVRAIAKELTAVGAREPTEIAVQEGLRAEVDPALARTLFEILLGNSLKFSANVAAPCIEVGVVELDGLPTFFIRDNGAGFDIAHVAQLFVPFGRLHTVVEFEGAGIGLAMAQRIVGRHGGRVWGEGQVGKGAVFHFTLPAKRGDAEPRALV